MWDHYNYQISQEEIERYQLHGIAHVSHHKRPFDVLHEDAVDLTKFFEQIGHNPDWIWFGKNNGDDNDEEHQLILASHKPSRSRHAIQIDATRQLKKIGIIYDSTSGIFLERPQGRHKHNLFPVYQEELKVA